jgi:hypothetical protein
MDFDFPTYPPVDRPTVRFYLEDRPFDPRWENTVAVQWIGETPGGRLIQDPHFRFHLTHGLSTPDLWSGDKDFCRVAFIGPIREWHRPERIPALAEGLGGGSADAFVAWIVNHSRQVQSSSGQPMPHNVVLGVVQLGDRTYGPIIPRTFTDLAILQRDEVWDQYCAKVALEALGARSRSHPTLSTLPSEQFFAK